MPDAELRRLGFGEKRIEAIRELAEPLFAEAVAAGLHAPFAYDCDYQGRLYADKLIEALGRGR